MQDDRPLEEQKLALEIRELRQKTSPTGRWLRILAVTVSVLVGSFTVLSGLWTISQTLEQGERDRLAAQREALDRALGALASNDPASASRGSAALSAMVEDGLYEDLIWESLNGLLGAIDDSREAPWQVVGQEVRVPDDIRVSIPRLTPVGAFRLRPYLSLIRKAPETQRQELWRSTAANERLKSDRVYAVSNLGPLDDSWRQLLYNPDQEASRAALVQLTNTEGEHADKRLVEFLQWMDTHGTDTERLAIAAYSVGTRQLKSAVSVLKSLANKETLYRKVVLMNALGRIGTAESLDALVGVDTEFIQYNEEAKDKAIEHARLLIAASDE